MQNEAEFWITRPPAWRPLLLHALLTKSIGSVGNTNVTVDEPGDAERQPPVVECSTGTNPTAFVEGACARLAVTAYVEARGRNAVSSLRLG